jgi:hypothetical protein
MAGFMLIAIAAAVTAGALLGAFLVISLAIRREDRQMTLRRPAPDPACRGAREVTGYRRFGWESPSRPGGPPRA